MSWNDERIELLKKLWSEGFSASQIAAEIGGISRNAVIGKVHRLGLSGRAKAPAAVAPRARKPRSASSRPSGFGRGNLAYALRISPEDQTEPDLAPRADVFENVVPIGQRCSILELNESTCRWPLGEPGREDFAYCGGHTVEGLPYCGYHARIAYQPVADRRRERRAARG